MRQSDVFSKINRKSFSTSVLWSSSVQFRHTRFCSHFGVSRVVCGVHLRLRCPVGHATAFVVNDALVASQCQHCAWTVPSHPPINAEHEAGQAVHILVGRWSIRTKLRTDCTLERVGKNWRVNFEVCKFSPPRSPADITPLLLVMHVPADHPIILETSSSNAYRCRSKQIFGGAKDFCPNFPKLAQKVAGRLLPTNFLPQRSWRPFLGVTSKKNVFICFSANVFKSHNVGHHFFPNSQGFCLDI